MSLYRDEAVVLRTWKLGEADRIVSLHTRIFGKVRGVVKGVRRTRSKFGSRLEPAGHVEVQLYRGRGDLDTVTQAETISRFASLRSNPNRFAQASAMLEAVEWLSPDREPDSRRHVMLAKALAALDRYGSQLVVAGFLLKLLSHEGVRPFLDSCVMCAGEESLDRFHLLEGGVMCRDCSRDALSRKVPSVETGSSAAGGGLDGGAVRIGSGITGRGLGGDLSSSPCRRLSPEALKLLRMILGGALAAALRHPEDAVAREVGSLSVEAMEIHIERRLRSLAVLDGDRRSATGA